MIEECGHCLQPWDNAHAQAARCPSRDAEAPTPHPGPFRPLSDAERDVGRAGLAAARAALGPIDQKYRKPERNWKAQA